MKNIIRVVAGALLVFALAGRALPAQAAGDEAPADQRAADGAFLQLTDIHFTPYSDAQTLAKLAARARSKTGPPSSRRLPPP